MRLMGGLQTFLKAFGVIPLRAHFTIDDILSAADEAFETEGSGRTRRNRIRQLRRLIILSESNFPSRSRS
jgi:hypothetical protein